MREYKFRGKRIDNGEWVIGDLVRLPRNSGSWSEPPSPDMEWWIANHGVITREFVNVDPDTVGQYTGLKDRSGVEVYEGDFIQDEIGVGEVEWVQEHCAFMVFTRNPSMYLALESDGNLKNSEVIGSVHTHPHLLEQGEKE